MSEKQQLPSYLNSDIFSFYLFLFFFLATSRHIHSFRTVCPAVVLQSYSTYWLLVFKLHFLNLLNSHRPNSATLLSDIVSHVIRCLLNCVNHTSRNQQPVSQKHNSLHMHLFLDLPNTQCENCISLSYPSQSQNHSQAQCTVQYSWHRTESQAIKWQKKCKTAIHEEVR